MKIFSAVHTHVHKALIHISQHIQTYFSVYLMHLYPVHISVVVLSIGPIAASVLGGAFSINISAYTFPTLQDRSFLSFGF